MASLWADPQALETVLRTVEPAVRILPERHVRKLIAASPDGGLPDPAQPRWVDGNAAGNIVSMRNAAGTVLVLSAADDRLPGQRDDASVLRVYWRLLVRAAVWRMPIRSEAAGSLSRAFLREARFVLAADGVISHESSDAEFLPALAACLAELHAFEPDRLPGVFPFAPPANQAISHLVGDIDLARLVESLRPAGAAESSPLPEDAAAVVVPPEPDDAPAADAKARGNFVRAAIRATRAAAGSPDRESHTRRAESYLRQGVISRLAVANGWATDQSEAWFRALLPLLPAAAAGTWPPAAKALYDLQKLAADLTGELRVVTPIEWCDTFGRHPFTRSLADMRDVILHRGLSRVVRHLERVPLADRDRELLDELLEAELMAADGRIRHDLGPKIHAALDAAGLVETNVAERVARGKLVNELLDRICDVGFLRMSDLRDAIARNNLKLPDLRGLRQLERGDALLQADKWLANSLYGVYHRGEIYLRLIQRASAVAFGTVLGRLLTLFVVLPFGGAFVALEGLQHAVHLVQGGVAKLTGPPAHPSHVELVSAPAVLALGLFLLVMLNVPAARRVVVSALFRVLNVVRTVLIDGPGFVWRLPILRAVRTHPVVRGAIRLFGISTILTAAVVVYLSLLGVDYEWIAVVAIVTFLGIAVLANLPVGLRLYDSIAESWSDGWRAIRATLIPGVIGWVLWLFRELLGAVDRAVYAVDEKFRYRTGASRPSVALRAVLAVLWFPVAYLIRFTFYLLIEPQVNPVKHFPVVTVSHKMILPLAPSLTAALGSKTAAGVIIMGCPGIFGFLAWELMANWRLYAANRRTRLAAVPIGHHGESVRGLLRLGFHSGTIPRAYKKLRMGWMTGTRPLRRKEHAARHDLHHIETAIARLLVRELFAYWRQVPATAELDCRVGAVRLGVQRIEADVVRDGEPDSPLQLAFEYRVGRIESDIVSSGFVDRLTPAERDVVERGLAGLSAVADAQVDDSSVVGWSNWVEFWDTQAAGKSRHNGRR